MDDLTWFYETTLLAKPVSAPRARAFVCRHLIEHGVAYLVDPVRLVVSELATNAVLHGGSSFTVTLSCTDRSVRLAVGYQSPVGQVPAQVQRSELSGRGLRVVELISSEWGVGSDGQGVQTVWASFDLRHHQLS